MEIKIKADGFSKEVEIRGSNDHLDNFNFIDIIIEEESYTVDLDDLLAMCNSFETLRTLNDKREATFKK